MAVAKPGRHFPLEAPAALLRECREDKRCCLPRIDAVARELRDRDALLADIVEGVRDEHEQTLEDASPEITVVRRLRGRVGGGT